jgi:hypothetical protein
MPRHGSAIGVGTFRDSQNFYRADTAPAGQPEGSATMSSVVVLLPNLSMLFGNFRVLCGRTSLVNADGGFGWRQSIPGGVDFFAVDTTPAKVEVSIAPAGGTIVAGATYDGTTLRFYLSSGEIGGGVVATTPGITVAAGALRTSVGARDAGDRSGSAALALWQHREDGVLTGPNMIQHLLDLEDDLRNQRPFRAMTGMEWEWNAEDAGLTWIDRVAGITLDRTGAPESYSVHGEG